MEERGPILRLLLIGAIGIALVLLARWMAGRIATSSASGEEQRTSETRAR